MSRTDLVRMKNVVVVRTYSTTEPNRIANATGTWHVTCDMQHWTCCCGVWRVHFFSSAGWTWTIYTLLLLYDPTRTINIVVWLRGKLYVKCEIDISLGSFPLFCFVLVSVFGFCGETKFSEKCDLYLNGNECHIGRRRVLMGLGNWMLGVAGHLDGIRWVIYI